MKAKVNLRSVFDRKNYFYPDLPQGYQISQYKSPIVGEGAVAVESRRRQQRRRAGSNAFTSSRMRQKPSRSAPRLFVRGPQSLRRCADGDCLKAGFTLSRRSKAFIAKLRSILRYLGTCDGDMEKGNLRADVNVSVRRPGEPFGTRCEIKNMNSISFIGQAIEHEARRQIEILEEGEQSSKRRVCTTPMKETRSMRSKEEAHDYRYFPDPDLLPLEFDAALCRCIGGKFPELPDEKKSRFMRDFSLSDYDAAVLVAERETAEFFEAVVKGRDGKAAANWVINELFGRLNKEGRTIASSPVSAGQLGAMLDLIRDGTISGKIAKDLFEIVWTEGGDPRAIVAQRGMKQVTDIAAIEKVVDDIVAKNPDKVADARSNPKAIGWFVGQVMKSSGGKASPQAVNDILKRKLGL